MRTDLPILILSGSKDPVGEETKGVRRVYERYDKAGAEDLSIGFYEDARHELLNELNRDPGIRGYPGSGSGSMRADSCQ